MNFGAWPKMTKNKLRCKAEMRYQWTKMNLDAQCFEFEMVTKWPSMNCGAKLRCTKTEQEWSSVRNLANSLLWQNYPEWTSVRSWDALTMIKMNLGAQCFVIDVVSKMAQNENWCEVKCILLKQLLQSSKNYKRTSVGNVSTFKWQKNEPRCETEMFATNEQNVTRCAMFRPWYGDNMTKNDQK